MKPSAPKLSGHLDREIVLDRRGFLVGGAAATLALCGSKLVHASAARTVQSVANGYGRVYPLIDVHHHLFPPELARILGTRLPRAALPGVHRSLNEMNESGTTAAMISYPNSGITSLPEKRLTSLLRDSNDYAMGLVHKYPKRYGLFASIPMPYVSAARMEIARAFDELHADGILLLTSYDNKWLGDPAFEPVMHDLNARRAVVFVHPGVSPCCRNLLPGIKDAIVEYETDTARTITSLMFSGTAQRFPDIQFIFCHSGGTMPILIERYTTATKHDPALARNIPKGVLAYLRAFHYDTAQSANPEALGDLLKLVPSEQVMFGTDFPWRRAPSQIRGLEAMKLPVAEVRGILGKNAQALIPRLRALG
jgi:predicted TIM-barrel fold metal-dependent hydrolase